MTRSRRGYQSLLKMPRKRTNIKLETCAKRFEFFGATENEKLTVSIPEIVEPSYGMYIWPSAPVLAQFVWHQRDQIARKTILELGAGTSLPGIVAAKCGASLVLSDGIHLPQCLENCRASCQANGLSNVRVVGITWGHISPDLMQLCPDIILGSDTFYDTKDFENVVMTVAYLLEGNPSAEYWTSYQERSSDRSLVTLLQKWGLQCTHIPLSSFGAASSRLAGSELPGAHTIQMLLMRKVGQ